jgi:hypothetical protein
MKRIIKTCSICNKQFTAKTKHVKTCSPECRNKQIIKGRKTLSSKCINCGDIFIHKDVKAKKCKKCRNDNRQYREKNNIEYFCICGCGRKTNHKNSYTLGCHHRGKSYKEIYGTSSPNCGFQKGKNNPMANPKTIQKIKSSVSKKDILYNNIYFRNNYELKLYQTLESLGIQVEYEPTLKIDGKLYLPDFVIFENNKPSKIYEISGYASVYEKSRDRNINKLRHIKKTYPECDIIFLVDNHLISGYNKYNIDGITLLPYYFSRKEPFKGVLYK